MRYWPQKEASGFIVWRYELRRDDPTPAPWTKEGKKRIEEMGYEMIYPEGYLEAQAEKAKLAGKNGNTPKSKKESNKRRRRRMVMVVLLLTTMRRKITTRLLQPKN